MRFYRLCNIAFLFFIGACSASAENVIIDTKNGPHIFAVEIAAKSPQHQRGLMFRESLDPDAGMLFVFSDVAERQFWMKNVKFPLDILFIGADGRIFSIVHGKPGDETLLPSGGPVVAALEILGGQADKRGIAPGDPVRSRALKKTEKTP